jgi:uncharacterized protein YxjI
MSNTNFLQQINFKSSEDKFTPTELLFKYLSYLPLFIFSLLVCISVAVSILRYTVPMFKSTTRLLIKNNSDNKPSFSSRGGGDLIETALFSNNQLNLDNEIMAIKATPFIQKIVSENKFNYSYLNEGNFKNTELYGNLPFTFELINWRDSLSNFQIYLTNLSDSGGIISSSKKMIEKLRFKWNATTSFAGSKFILHPKMANGWNDNYFFNYEPPSSTANNIISNLSVFPNNSKTTIIQLELQGENLLKISTILNVIADRYAIQAFDEKNLIANNTIKFINQRLEIVTAELGNVEGKLSDFKKSNKMVDVTSLAGEVNAKRLLLDDNLLQIGIQDQLIELFQQQIKDLKDNKRYTNFIGFPSFPLYDVEIYFFFDTQPGLTPKQKSGKEYKHTKKIVYEYLEYLQML